MTTTTPHHRVGDRVSYQGRVYRVLSVSLRSITGPHYRLAACGDYQNEDLTGHILVSAYR